MLAAPWYLSSLGLLLIVLGLIGSLAFGGGRANAGIDPRMSDAEIVRRLNRRNSLGFPGLLMYAGLLCLLVGIGWRLLRAFI